MAFLTIHAAEGLTPYQRRRASRDGPVAVAVSRPHRELLPAAGFVEITESDLSDEFATVTQGWIEQWDAHRSEMQIIWGQDVVQQRQQERRKSLLATRQGILRRSLFTALRP
jgi:hypothetical protein